ncbi:hypothetical protein [Microbacterium sp. LCT-H2]|uniref:hypothetical protein n=1 Tax=Microbacterium sp. LCT-H2 TaxID=1914306 RepID=UPI0008F4C972|nr:hypothetical protein [Microbacterium sp. LCT-H2]OIJ33472.1 hypothetical protein BK819_06660 [Microbacterium sp. LCT-H2]
MTTDIIAGPFLTAVRQAWDRARGTLIVPREFTLTELAAGAGSLSAEVTDSTGTRFGFRVPLPAAARWEGKAQGGEGTPEHWALWSVIIPLMEELETDGGRRFAPDADGVRWVTA